MAKHFPLQREGEELILLVRRHWTIIAKPVGRLIFFHFVPLFLFVFLFGVLEWEIPSQGLGYIAMILLSSLYFLFIWLFYFHEFVDYHCDVWIVTNERILSIELAGLFNHTTAELNLYRVQDVTTEIKGKTQTFLNFGNVHIQTAGEIQRFVFEEVPHPQAIAQVITRLHRNLMRQ